jgi:hypothetical protein
MCVPYRIWVISERDMKDVHVINLLITLSGFLHDYALYNSSVFKLPLPLTQILFIEIDAGY